MANGNRSILVVFGIVAAAVMTTIFIASAIFHNPVTAIPEAAVAAFAFAGCAAANPRLYMGLDMAGAIS